LRQRTVVIGSIVIVLTVGTIIGVYLGVYYSRQSDEDIVLTLQSSTSTMNYTMTDLMEFDSIEGYGGYKRATGTVVGPHWYKGVSLGLLLDEVGGIILGEELEVIASDNWKITYTSQMLNGNVVAYNSITGENLGIKEFQIILAYEEDGSKIPTDDGPIRIAFISEEEHLTDGNLWAKKVQTMKIKTSSNMWTIYLYGITNDSISRLSFEAAMYSDVENHSVFYVLQEDTRFNTYQGMPLWCIISIIDGELFGSSHYTFNDTLAALGYDVILRNSEEEISLHSSDIARNNSYILAAKRNSVFLGENEGPLRLVGSALTGSQMIYGITEIRINL
jgi:hypothetical protein